MKGAHLEGAVGSLHSRGGHSQAMPGFKYSLRFFVCKGVLEPTEIVTGSVGDWNVIGFSKGVLETLPLNYTRVLTNHKCHSAEI